jgi:hypothetical protein
MTNTTQYKIQHWEAYQETVEPGASDLFDIEVDDQLTEAGQLHVVIGGSHLSPGCGLAATVEISSDPPSLPASTPSVLLLHDGEAALRIYYSRSGLIVQVVGGNMQLIRGDRPGEFITKTDARGLCITT